MGYYNNKKRNKNKKPREDNYIPPFPAEVLAKPLSEFRFGERTAELLAGANINTVLELVKKEEKDLYRISTFNKKNLLDVIYTLKRNGGLFLKPAEKPEEKAGEKPQDKRQNLSQAPRGDNNSATVKNDRKDGRKEQRDFGKNHGKTENSNDRNRDEKRFGKERTERFAQVSEKQTKAEREKLRPKKTKVEYYSDPYVKINKNGKWGFMTRDGKEVIDARFDDVSVFKEDLCCVEIDGKMGYIDRNGSFVIEPQYDLAMSFSEGLANVYRGETCGYIDKDNNVVVDFRYEAGTAFSDGSCRVKKDGKWGELYFTEKDGAKTAEVRWII